MKSPLEHPGVSASVGEELEVGGSWPRDNTLTPTAAIAHQLLDPTEILAALTDVTILRRWHGYRIIITEDSTAEPTASLRVAVNEAQMHRIS